MIRSDLDSTVTIFPHNDGLDITDCPLKTINSIGRLYKAIDAREGRDRQLLEEYERNAVSTNALAEETGIARTTLAKTPYADIIDAHRRKPARDARNDDRKVLLEENETLRRWQEGHAQTEIELLQVKKELEQTRRKLDEKEQIINRKDQLLQMANERLKRNGYETVTPDTAANYLFSIQTGGSHS